MCVRNYLVFYDRIADISYILTKKKIVLKKISRFAKDCFC